MLEKLKGSFVAFGNEIIDKAPAFVFGVILLVGFVIIGKVVQGFSRKRLIHRMDDLLMVNFISRMLFLAFATIGVLIFLGKVGLDKAAGGLVAGAGVSALILGFAFKDIGENFLAGFFLAFSRPFGIGDVIEVEDMKGTVKALSFRNSHIRTFDGKDIFVPNAMLMKNPLINYTRDGLLRHDFTIGLDYDSDLIKALQIMDDYLKNEDRIEQSDGLKPFLQLEEFGTSTMNIQVYYWINSFNFQDSVPKLKTEVMHNVLKALMNANFNMPADIVELKIYQEGQPIPVRMIS